MKKIDSVIIIALCIAFNLIYASCSEDETFKGQEKYSTTFRVYECNEDFEEEYSVSSRYVSEDAIITIWKLNDSNGYDVVKQLKTGIDGTVQYQHNDELIFYTVNKIAENSTITQTNLVVLSLKDDLGRVVNTALFQVDGVFTSQDDIDTSVKFNFGVAPQEYSPKVGALKFKDINGDGYIDIEDSISRAMVDMFWHDGEEIVYLAPSK